MTNPRIATAPGDELHWRYEPAPPGVKCHLLNPDGVAITGPATGAWGDEYIAWHPMARRDKQIERGEPWKRK